jgi:hypothetical protein
MMEFNPGAQAPTGTAVKTAVKTLESERLRSSGVPDSSNPRPRGILSVLILVRDTVLVTFDALRGRYDG